MALTVMNNSSAAMALGELNKNSNRLSKDLKKVSSGTKIIGAGDGASEYAISEGMRSMIRALEQDIQNSKTGRDLIKVAEGGIQSIIEELRTLKELAINSANDHNSEVDRATLQKEFDQRMANIDNIAEETNYNGKLLLNGTYRRMLEGGNKIGLGNVLSSDTVTTVSTTPPVNTSTTSTSVRTSSPINNTTRSTTVTTSTTMPTTGTTEGSPVTTTNTVRNTATTGPTTSTNSNTVTTKDITEDENTVTEVCRDLTTTNTTNTTVETVTETTTTTTTKVSTIVSAEAVTVAPGYANVRMITNGMTALTEGGVWKFADDYTGNLTISEDNVTILGADNTLSDVYITDTSNNLYLKNVNISNTQGKSAVAFTGTSGTLHIIGENSIEEGLNSGSSTNAVINSQGDISLVGSGSLNITRKDNMASSSVTYYGAVIGGNSGQTCGSITVGSGLKLEIKEIWNRVSSDYGAAIGTGSDGRCGDITIGSNATVEIVRSNSRPSVFEYQLYGNFNGPSIGAASGAIAGDIYLLSDANVTIYQKSDYQCPCIGAGRSNGSCGNITGYTDSKLTYTNSWNQRSCPEDNYIGIGAGTENCSCGNITYCVGGMKGLHGIEAFDIPSVNFENFVGAKGSNSCGTKSNLVITEYRYSDDADNLDPSTMPITTYNVTTETITTTTTTATVNESKTTTYETSTEICEDITTTVYEKTTGEAVRLNIPLIIHTGPKANEELRVYIEDMGPEALGIMDVKIDPREAAIKALGEIDHAIDYALDQAVQMGAYISRLEQTEENLVIASENAQSSESTIRDADMAKEMTAYTKDNILTQSAQAMLAQANQNAGGVLSLLQ